MVSRIFKGAAAVVATLSLAGVASAQCGAGTYCGQSSFSSVPSISSWTGNTGSSWTNSGGSNFSVLSSQQADASYGTGSISDTFSDTNTFNFSGSTASVPGLGHNESLQATNCPVNVYGAGEGRVLGCYNVVQPVPQTTYYRVVRPVVYVRYPVPVAVPYTSPCHTFEIKSRYGDLPGFQGRPSCG